MKNPPPFVPSCLIASWLATGPIASTCFAPSTVVTVTLCAKFWITPCWTKSSPYSTLNGRNRYSVPRTRSAQKFPMRPPADRRTMPRANAIATATPAAADMKLWKASWVICEKYDIVVSPEYDCQLVFVVNEAAVSNACRSGTAAMCCGLSGNRCCRRSTM